MSLPHKLVLSILMVALLAFGLLVQHYRTLLHEAESATGASAVAAPAVAVVPTTDKGDAPPPVVAVADKGPAATAARVAELEKQVAALRAENRKLRDSLIAADPKVAKAPDVTAAPGAPPADGDGRNRNRQRMQEMSARMQTAMGEQTDFINGLDVSKMTKEQKENHDKLVATLDAVKQQMAEMQAGGDGAPPSAEARQQMMQNMGELRGLFDNERQFAFSNLASSLNYSGAEAQQFTDYINYVFKMTSPNTYFTGGMRGNRAPGGTSGATPATGR